MPIDPWNVFSAHLGQIPRPLTALATLIDMAVYFAFCVLVSTARTKHGVEAPQTQGPDPFMRALRVQQNTAEQLVLHLPLLWIAAFALSDAFAASLGVVWALSRLLYARGYLLKPKRRAKGFIIGTVIDMLLFTGAIVGVWKAI